MANSRPNRPPSIGRRGAVPFGLFAACLGTGVLLLGEVFHGVMVGASAFLIHRQLIVRGWLLADHNRGVQLARDQKHAAALEAFRASERVWSQRPRLDQWRGLLLASASRWSFRAQARYNQALCLHSLDRPAEAFELVRQQLDHTPHMAEARALFEHLAATRGDTGEAWTVLSARLDHDEGALGTAG